VVELDEESQAYFNATVTDIDLFSSYGMLDKALELATQLVGRMPQHPLANEKLLDLYIASSNNSGVAEIAVRLENIYREAGNYQRAEELNRMAQKYGGLAPAAAAAPKVAEPAAVAHPALEPAPPAEEEVDLSAEWMAAASSEGLVAPETAEAPLEPAPVEEAAPAEEPAPVFNASEATEEIGFYLNQGMLDMARDVLTRYEQDFPGEAALSELRRRVDAAAAAPPPAVEAAPEPVAAPEPIAEPEQSRNLSRQPWPLKPTRAKATSWCSKSSPRKSGPPRAQG
jgi:tetratricopeptide (TPR) repeat protein